MGSKLKWVQKRSSASGLARLERATYIMARANYRQTCVDLRDGILQPQPDEPGTFTRQGTDPNVVAWTRTPHVMHLPCV